MIKLTTNPKSNPIVHTFQKKVILIGKGTSPEIDLAINQSGPDVIQVKIVNQNDCFVIINLIDSPLIKINALPFKKKIINDKDLLQIETTKILINIESASEVTNDCSYYLSEDFDDEGENWNSIDNNEKEQEASPYKLNNNLNNWKLFISIIFSILSLIVICSSVIYVNLNDKTKREEISAAEGVADVAMALTYAQINHIKPLTQNWSNPEFLKNTFLTIVPSNYPFLANIDSHGQFSNCPYFLRIYTSNDFSSFLVVAQPAPSLLQWLIPKSAIFVHSKTMELRKIEDLKALNRLLVNPNTLDGANGIEITNLVQDGTLVPLTSLSIETKDQGFTPPKALSLRRPGAENLIYNALRYYQFSEMYVKRALELSKAVENSPQELAKLQQEMLKLSKLENLVLYSSSGIESAIQAQKALSTFIPFGHFLNAYVIFNSEGKISGSGLLMEGDQNHSDIALNDSFSDHQVIKTEEIDHILGIDTEEEAKHPVLFELLALSSARSRSLKVIAKEINQLLEEEISAYHPEFGMKLADLAIKFQQKDLEEKEKIAKMLSEIYDDYSGMRLAHILPLIKSAGLEEIVAEMLALQNKNYDEQNLSQELVGAQLNMIKKAKSFEELDESITKASDLLNLKSIPNAEILIVYQNEMVLLVAEKLEEFLLSPNFQLPKTEFKAENRDVLNHILESSWITDPHEVSFYLNEFDHLKELK